MDFNQTVEAVFIALQLHEAVEHNQTIIAIKEASEIKDFSRFGSLLEVAFALNVSYHIIPNMYNIGKKKIDTIETKKVQEWDSKIAEATSRIKELKPDDIDEATLSDDDKISIEAYKNTKTTYQTLINTIKSASEEPSPSERKSKAFSAAALYAAVMSIILLFLGSLGVGCMDSLSPSTRDFSQTLIVVILLSPNILALGFQLKHWKNVETNLNTVITALEKNNTKT